MMEIRDDGVRVMKSAKGPGKMLFRLEGQYLRIETEGVMLLNKFPEETINGLPPDLSEFVMSTIKLWRNTGFLPSIDKEPDPGMEARIDEIWEQSPLSKVPVIPPAEEPGCQLSNAMGGEEPDIATTEQLIERGLVCPTCGHDKTWHKCELCGCHQRDVRYAIAEEPDHLSTSEVVAILKPPTEDTERVGKDTPWDTGDARVNELLDQGCELGEALDQAAEERKKEEDE